MLCHGMTIFSGYYLCVIKMIKTLHIPNTLYLLLFSYYNNYTNVSPVNSGLYTYLKCKCVPSQLGTLGNMLQQIMFSGKSALHRQLIINVCPVNLGPNTGMPFKICVQSTQDLNRRVNVNMCLSTQVLTQICQLKDVSSQLKTLY